MNKHFPGLHDLIRLSLLLIIVLSAITLITYRIGGWQLLTLGSGYVPMAPLTASFFILISVFTLLQTRMQKNLIFVNLSIGITCIIAIIIGLDSLNTIIPEVPGFEEYLIQAPEQVSGIPVGVMSPLTALLFLFTCLSYVLGFSAKQRYRDISPVIALVIVATGMIVVEGYLFDTPVLYGGSLVPVAFTTGWVFFFLGLALLSSRKDDTRLGDALFGPSVKALLLRSFLPAMILFALLNTWIFSLFVYHRAEYNPVLWSGLSAVISVGVIVLITTVLSRQIGGEIDRAESERDRSDRELRQAHSKLTQVYHKLENQETELLRNYDDIAAREEELCSQNDELRQQRDALTRSESRYFELFDHISSGVIVYEPLDDGSDFIIKDLNRASEQIDNLQKKQVIGKRLTEVFPGFRESGMFDAIRTVYQIGKPLDLPASLYQDDRISGWREHYIYRLLSGEMVIVYDDITDKKRAEEELKRSEAQYRFISEHAADVIWIFDLNTRKIRYVSPSVFKLRGYTPEEVLTQDLCDMLTPDSYSQVSQALPGRIAQFLAGDESSRVHVDEITQPHKDGSIIPTEVVTTLVPGKDGAVVEVIGVSRDIRERKASEKKLNVAISQLTKNLETLATLNDQIRNPLMIIELISGEMNEETPGIIHDQVMKIDDLINQVDIGFLESDTVRGFLTRHYHFSFDETE